LLAFALGTGQPSTDEEDAMRHTTAHRWGLCLAIAALLLACSDGEVTDCPDGTAGVSPNDDGKPPPDPRCSVYADPAKIAKIEDEKLDEMSGLAASVQHEGLLWTHNDSGGGPYIYAIDASGEMQGRLKLKDAKSRDWEDMALGPCVAGDGHSAWACLYVGDVGDNSKKHETGTIYRVAEPTKRPVRGVDGPDESTVTIGQWHSWTFIWPDGPRNIESLGMLKDRRAILMTRDSSNRMSEVWRVDLNVPGDVIAEKLGELDMANEEADSGPTVTVGAADVSPSGEQLLVRTQKDIYLFEVGAALRLPAKEAKAALKKAKREVLPHGYDPMAEAVAWDPKEGYWHTSEATSKTIPRLWRSVCAVD